MTVLPTASPLRLRRECLRLFRVNRRALAWTVGGMSYSSRLFGVFSPLATVRSKYMCLPRGRSAWKASPLLKEGWPPAAPRHIRRETLRVTVTAIRKPRTIWSSADYMMPR